MVCASIIYLYVRAGGAGGGGVVHVAGEGMSKEVSE